MMIWGICLPSSFVLFLSIDEVVEIHRLLIKRFVLVPKLGLGTWRLEALLPETISQQ